MGDAPVVSHDPIPEAEKPHESSSPVTEKPEVVAPIIGNDQHTPTSVVDVDTSVPISVAPPSMKSNEYCYVNVCHQAKIILLYLQAPVHHPLFQTTLKSRKLYISPNLKQLNQ